MFLSACSLMSVCVSVRLSVWPPICMPMWKYVRLSVLLSTLLYASIEWLIVLDLTALWDSISAYIGPPPREGESKEKRQTREKCPNNPYPHLLQAQEALALLLSKLVGCPGTVGLPSAFASPDHPFVCIHEWFMLACLSVCPSIRSSIRLSDQIDGHTKIHLSVRRPSVHQSVYPSVSALIPRVHSKHSNPMYRNSSILLLQVRSERSLNNLIICAGRSGFA